MKKLMLIAIAAATFTACNDSATTTETTTVETDTMGSSPAMTSNYTPGEGDVMYREEKVMEYRNGVWVETTTKVTLEDGAVVSKNGVVTKDGKEVKLEEGEAVSKTGRFFDRAGQGIENAWDATKKGVNEAGEAIERGAEKVGQKTKEIIN